MWNVNTNFKDHVYLHSHRQESFSGQQQAVLPEFWVGGCCPGADDLFFFFGDQRLVDGKMVNIAGEVCRISGCGIECKFAVPSSGYYDIKSKYRNF